MNLLPREFKVLAKNSKFSLIKNYKDYTKLIREFKSLGITQKWKIWEIKVTRKIWNLQYVQVKIF